jgi:hypothetical protein
MSRQNKHRFTVLIATLALGLGLLVIGENAKAQTNCGTATPVSNDSCLRLQRAAEQSCYSHDRMYDRYVLQRVMNVRISCSQYGGNGACISAQYECVNEYKDTRSGEFRRIPVVGGVRG